MQSRSARWYSGERGGVECGVFDFVRSVNRAPNPPQMLCDIVSDVISRTFRQFLLCFNLSWATKPLVSAQPLCCSSKMNSGFHNWSDIRVFLAVLRAGSTLAASKQLGMAQPTVARRIDALEHALKLPLFERDTRGFRPTQDAQRLTALAEAIEVAIGAFASEAENSLRANSRPIRITAPRTNFSTSFAAILSEFSAKHPGTHFEFISTNELIDLSAGEADVAIRIAKTIDDERLICRKLTEVTGSIYASEDYADRNGLPGSVSEFDGHTFVVYDSYASSLGVNEWLMDRIDSSQIVTRCSDAESMIAAIKVGIGIGIVATSMAKDDGTLVRCIAPPEGTSANSWLLISPDAYRRPEVKAFSAFFAPRYQAIFKNVNVAN
jgi:DNA-binding transcriptional LysR family regulator